MVATMAVFVGMDLSARIAHELTRFRQLTWILAGALSIGLGIWTMHFIGMLGFQLPIAVSYDFGITLGSLALAVAGCGVALALGVQTAPGLGKLLGAGSFFALAIIGMHYTGMAAMRIVPPIRYDPRIVGLSIAIAFAASTVAVW